MYCKVHARGVLLKQCPVQSRREAEEVLKKTDSMQLCAGAMRLQDYDETFLTVKLKGHVLTRQEVYFSRNCSAQVSKQGISHIYFCY